MPGTESRDAAQNRCMRRPDEELAPSWAITMEQEARQDESDARRAVAGVKAWRNWPNLSDRNAVPRICEELEQSCYWFNRRFQKPRRPCGMKITMAVKISPT